eukprot:gnl/MRDRNA2_/MRDRNA2_16141_c0_seq1.p1 gnl/MRDRNA2_/MRDRNA2_16141_c0~~gnl/MRDRNA2_/MRDRNA2_16141_c0_seq1.p1  ORF type:complete len:235 (-),score=43.13 gnl/MRDRNA2_/MRDRNA2_16141_c0_seq1:54-758(-)
MLLVRFILNAREKFGLGPCCPCRRRRWRHDERRRLMQEQWNEAGIQQAELMVRSLSGDVIYEQDQVQFHTSVESIVQKICDQNGVRRDTVQLCCDGNILDHGSQLGDCIVPSNDEKVELTFVRLVGPALTVEATSGREIQILDKVPAVGDRCHLDRTYKFISLGDFAEKPKMKYLLTSNDDKTTSNRNVMWKLDLRVAVVVHLNFRSERHVRGTGAMQWLQEEGWEESSMRSTI